MHDELALFNNLEPMPTLLQGDARALPLGDESVDLIVTSPPYFGLRDYGTIGQIGSEPGPLEFIKALIACTREMVRVLKPSGSIFVNLNDKYNSAASGQNGTKSTGLYAGRCEPGTRAAGRHDRMSGRGRVHPGVPLKSLMLLPERYRVGCVDELGLTVRAVIVWEKANGLPEPVTDRVRRSHEDWVHLTKQARYYGATNEIREPNADGSPAGRLPHASWSSRSRARRSAPPRSSSTRSTPDAPPIRRPPQGRDVVVPPRPRRGGEGGGREERRDDVGVRYPGAGTRTGGCHPDRERGVRWAFVSARSSTTGRAPMCSSRFAHRRNAVSERCSTCGRVVDLAGTHACWSAPAPSLRAEIAENEPTPERFLEMAEHIVEAIAHHHKYRELDVEILGETSRRLRLMAAAPSLRAELAEAKAEIARLTVELDRDSFILGQLQPIVEAASAIVEHYASYGTRDIGERVVYLAETIEQAERQIGPSVSEAEEGKP